MLSDDEVVARAEEAGWVWLPDTTGPSRWGRGYHWQTSESSAQWCGSTESSAAVAKIAVARKAFDHDRRCQECGLPKDANWDHVSKLFCFTCNFWLRLLPEDPSFKVVVNGTHYIAGGWSEMPPPWPEKKYLGFGGDKWVVVFHAGPNAGKTLTTYNLWHQGPIPERFRDRLPDNATFQVRAGNPVTKE